MSDDRQYAPATLRNRGSILDVLRDVLPMTGVILEIASGSGEHIVHFARNFPALVFQPSDPEPDARLSIAAWARGAGVTNVGAPIALDASNPVWPIASAHQHDPHLALGSDAGIGQWGCRDPPSGVAALPLRSAHTRRFATAPSNQPFDRSLRDRNPTWGLRDLEAVAAMAQSVGFSAPAITEMLANNLSVVFRRM
jgi:hypothetical protein